MRSTSSAYGQLLAGLALFGASLALMVRARLGLGAWDVLHQGIASRLDVQIGWVVIAVSIVVLLAWIPLRQRPGAGTVLNATLVGLFTNLTLDLLPAQHAPLSRAALLVAGIGLNAFATALYIGARLGPGPRDGLMLGLSQQRHVSIRRARTVIELAVLLLGWGLGGSVGIGTVLYAFAIGPLVQMAMSSSFTERLGRPTTECAGVTCAPS